ncbi:WecB/TagA/CpsF family glycosyltransferase [Microvirga makkahensis]|uniref:WecB/TagA/CpsF family glycosyltransferase n=1 Tax=Microvirga makkahensis TaxID=1128670 RepID=A0A7X3MUZ2_9HYPH|nr:WecB/TagA/CpsF family glycosyltransferase [Microvirga makkahensis]MXQ13748.1 WecB/TagA/CpsF family glycosyltransferase [Microvirga makkahensis]
MSNAVATSRTLGEATADDTALSWLSNAPAPEIIHDVTLDDGAHCDDLDREVYCLQGFPIDAIGMQEVMPRLLAAMRPHSPYLLSTPNLNFLAASQSDAGFQESLRTSDLCPPDGIALVWIARLLGIPIKERVAGSDIFEAFVTRGKPQRPLRVFLFGGAEGVAARAAEALNRNAAGVICVGWMNPGFGSVEEMSQSYIIDAINASGADFLLVALGAAKGQAWLQRNHHAIRVPVRSHLGATIAFVAGTVKRAPTIVRKLGLEWLWRIKEEPVLWKRYVRDVSVLSGLLITRVLPLTFASLLARARRAVTQRKCRIMVTSTAQEAKVSLLGDVSAGDVPALRAAFRQVVKRTDHLNIDLSGLTDIDARAIGLLMMLRKQMISKCGSFILSDPPASIRLLFRLHGVGDLLKHPTNFESHYSQGGVGLLRSDGPIQVDV